MTRSRFLQLDFGIQTAILLFFLLCILLKSSPLLSCILMCQLLLGAWQLLSSAVWGLFMADYFRGQFFFVAVLVLAGLSAILGLPEYRDAELLLWLAKFAAVIMMGIYYKRSFEDGNIDLSKSYLETN